MAFLSFDVRGLAELLAAYDRVGERAVEGARVGLHELGEDVMRASKDDYCPVRTGALRSSGLAHDVEEVGGVLEMHLSYGNDAVDYALYVHEDLEAHHTVGQAKYLEVPLNEIGAEAPERLAESMRAFLGL